MKNLLIALVSICAFSSVSGLADHASLERQASLAAQQTRALYYDARQVVGIYPTYQQKYALEHIQFLDGGASRFLQTIHWGMRHAADGSRDHAHDNRIRQAYSRLELDTYHARATFNDLFVTRDHAGYERLDRMLDSIEQLVRDMRYNLP